MTRHNYRFNELLTNYCKWELWTSIGCSETRWHKKECQAQFVNFETTVDQMKEIYFSADEGINIADCGIATNKIK
jgi:hypothetical protein